MEIQENAFFFGVYRSISYEKRIKIVLLKKKEGIKFLLGRKKYKMPEMPAVKKNYSRNYWQYFENASFTLSI